MKKNILIIGIIVICMSIFISSTLTDSIKIYDEKTKTAIIKDGDIDVANITLNTPLMYEVIRGEDRLVAEFTINNFYNYSDVFNDMDFYDIKNGMKKFNREFNYKYKTFYDVNVSEYETICSEREIWNEINKTFGTEKYDCYQNKTGSHIEQRFDWLDFDEKAKLQKGKITLGIFTNVEPNENIEWIPTLFGVKIDDFAGWNETFNVKLVSVYTFEEASGNLIDQVGSNDGLNSGADYQATGINNYAWDFEAGEKDNISIADNNDWKNGEMTFSVWVKPETLDNYMAIYAHGKDVAEEYRMYLGDARIACYGADDSLGNSGVLTTYALEIGAWEMITCIYNSTGVVMFINDTLIGNSSCDDTCSWTIGATFYISSIAGTQSFYDGLIDELYIWDDSKGDTFVENLYNSGIGTFHGIDFNVSLNIPVNNSKESSTIIFNASCNDDYAIHNITLWIDGVMNNTHHNISARQTFISYKNTTTNLAEGEHNYTFTCRDLNNIQAANSTLNISVDSIAPNLTINTPTATPSGSTIGIVNFTVNDVHLNTSSCFYNVTNLAKTLVYIAHTNVPNCLNKTDSTALSDETYLLNTITSDEWGNQNTTENLTFVISTAVPPGGGGPGGGGTTVVVGEGTAQWTMEFSGGISLAQFNLIQGTSRTKDMFFENIGESSRTISLICEEVEGKKNLCPYLVFETNQFELPLITGTKTAVSFTVTIPEDLEKDDYFANIKATDELNNFGILTVEGNVETFSWLTKFFTKLVSKRMFGEIPIPYYLLFVILIAVFGGGIFVVTKQTKLPGKGGVSLISALIISSIVILIV